MRLAGPASFLAALVAAICPAAAGDAAQLEVLGFSADGAVFAFEEWGVQDGSGFPYSNRFYVRTADDTFVPGTPVRVRLDDEEATVEAARSEARERGEAIVAAAELEANRGFTAASSPVTELSADPFRLVAAPRPVFPPIDAPLEFRLEEIPLGETPRCQGLGGISGFRLLRIHAEAGGVTELLHEDGSVPESRGCPTGYALGGVQTLFIGQAPAAYAVLISVRRVGFEGPDHRWIAVARRW
jgi:predicted secreted protein